MDPEDVLEGIEADYDQRLKRAAKALRLDAPHINNAVKIRETDEEFEKRVYGPRDATASDAASSDTASENHEASDPVSEELGASAPKEHESFEDLWTRRVRTERRCMECEKGICRGAGKLMDSQLMMLGSGELKGYSCDQ